VAKTKIPVFLGSDPFGFPNDVPIGTAELEGEDDISVIIKADKLKYQLDKLIEMGQIRGLALNIAYVAPAAKKDGE
jgi:hypothetical protein